jgi:hypothetical protein
LMTMIATLIIQGPKIGFWTGRVTRMENTLNLSPMLLTWSWGIDSRKSETTMIWGTTGAFVFVVGIPRLPARGERLFVS